MQCTSYQNFKLSCGNAFEYEGGFASLILIIGCVQFSGVLSSLILLCNNRKANNDATSCNKNIQTSNNDNYCCSSCCKRRRHYNLKGKQGASGRAIIMRAIKEDMITSSTMDDVMASMA